MTLFWTLWSIDALMAAILVAFFVIGLADGSVSSFNIVLWLGMLGAAAGLLWGSHALQAAGHHALAHGLLAAVAVPGVLFGLLLLMAVVLKPRWN
ncbi:hypothetical protein [Aquabacterium humicola]|uniref:hypothetical protein n=1 Tax=Aquabacterium humicola TaxID=3237377 RepID=UPI0025429FC3|nr:hypothetical protein [Rubrivivax pictus]